MIDKNNNNNSKDLRKIKLEGRRVGRLLILEYNSKNKRYLCICECGNYKELRSGDLNQSKVKSCGCILKERTPDLVGKKINMLTVLEKVSESGYSLFLCECECGSQKIFRGKDLNQDKVKSCGNHYRDLIGEANSTHKKTNTRIYKIYRGMMMRCFDENSQSYQGYGGRGISVCSEWADTDGFMSFYNWSMENGYDETLTIDRIDNERGYSPSNCRWTTREVQQNNRRGNILFTHEGETKTLAQWCKILNLKYDTIWKRIYKYNFSFEKAILHQIHKSKNN
ncbi:hypothetical protein ACH6EH_06995 [Paenibacillus sp. JSM ZJ436]|uniref:hypothetical protein n=1 Tax=Paenibacillus sp. JSM ZJ436 TaxID=3376190 RepID=UPI00378F9893